MKLATDVGITALFPEHRKSIEGLRTEGGRPFSSVEAEFVDEE